jgi:hypothetical protein
MVESLLKPFWKLRKHVIRMVFVPFIVQSIFCIYYFSLRLQHDNYEINFFSVISETVIITLSVFFLYLEYV